MTCVVTSHIIGYVMPILFFEQILTYQRKLSISLTFLSTLFVAQLRKYSKATFKIYVQNWTQCMA